MGGHGGSKELHGERHGLQLDLEGSCGVRGAPWRVDEAPWRLPWCAMEGTMEGAWTLNGAMEVLWGIHGGFTGSPWGRHVGSVEGP